MVPLGPICVGAGSGASVNVWPTLQKWVPLALTEATHHSYVCPGVSVVVVWKEVLLGLRLV